MDPNASTRHSEPGRLDSSATHDTTEHEKAQSNVREETNVSRTHTTVQRSVAHVKRHKWPYITVLVVVLILAIILPVM